MNLKISPRFNTQAQAVVHEGDCMDLLGQIPDEAVQLIITSPPYNLGKSYETKQSLEGYLGAQAPIIDECVRVLKPTGSICWQTGNYIEKDRSGSVMPLDIALYPLFAKHGLRLRNRIVWHFEHGLHCTKRFSGRYETICWFTKSEDYYFDVDPIRVPQKYPGKKHFKGPKAGQYSSNPLGKNPGDVWIIPNVKNNHVEKTNHPSQVPIESVERLVLSMSRRGEWVFDPFAGAGTTMAAAVRCGRRGAGAEVIAEYAEIARERILAAGAGQLRARERNTPVFDPDKAGSALREVPWNKVLHGANIETVPRSSREDAGATQLRLLEQPPTYKIVQ